MTMDGILNTPQALKDNDELIRITNELARNRVYIETSRRRNDWIAFVQDTPEIWEAGKTQLEAVQKLQVSVQSR